MNFLTIQAGLILAAAVIPPLVLLYFLKLRRRTQPIACTLLWKRSVEDLQANTPFQKLRRNLLLLLQLIALVLLALAIMQPQLQGGRSDGGKTILLIDTSASMTATDVDGGRTRLDEAKDRAANRIESLYRGGLFSQSGGDTMVIAFSDRAAVACPFTDSKPQLLEAIGRIEPTHGESSIDEAMTLARAYTTNVDPDSDRPAGVEPAALELFSDGRIPDLAEQVLRGETLLYHPIGRADADNVAFTAVAIERPYDRPTAVEVFVALANFDTEPVELDLQLSVNGAARAIEVVQMGPAETDASTGMLVPKRQNVVFTPFEQPLGAIVEIANLRADDLACDNVVRLVVPPPRRLSVAIIDADSFLLETVIEGMGSIERIERMSGRAFEQLVRDGELPAFDVVVLDDFKGTLETLPPGRYLSFGELPPLAGLNPYGLSKPQLVLDVAQGNPLFKFVNLDQLFIEQARLIQPANDIEVLAEGSEGPLIVRARKAGVDAVCVAFNPLDSNWPFQRSFVTFLVNAIEQLGHAGEAISSTSFKPGEALTARLPSSARDVELEVPGATAGFPVPVIDPAAFSWGPIRVSGVYAVTYALPGATDRRSQLFAVNALSDVEGDIRPADEVLAHEQAVQVAAAGGNQYVPLWPWAVGLCLVVMMLEWWVYHRRAYV